MNAPLLFDNHGRPLTYLRLAVTDRCNLRCFYCMPEEGIHYLPKKELLSFEEITRLVALLARMEPFVRSDLMELLRKIRNIDGIQSIHLTTNGLLTAPHLDELMRLGIRSVNLSLDTLDRDRFYQITRRDEFESTWRTLQLLLEKGFEVKINAVVMDGKNSEDIIPFVRLTEKLPLSIRFIEEMPFNGSKQAQNLLVWSHRKILDHIRSVFPSLQKATDDPHSTAYHYSIPGFIGNVGIIVAYTRSFCGSCNRIRITSQGVLKTCLYDDGVLNIKQLMRAGCSDPEMESSLQKAFQQRPQDGFEAEKRRKNSVTESMSTIGG